MYTPTITFTYQYTHTLTYTYMNVCRMCEEVRGERREKERGGEWSGEEGMRVVESGVEGGEMR